MNEIGDLILEIYRAAREQQIDDFRDFLLALLRDWAPFDSGRWFSEEFLGQYATTLHVYLQRQSVAMVTPGNGQHRLHDVAITNPSRDISILLWRGEADQHYVEAERVLLQEFTQHLLETLSQNRGVGVHEAVKNSAAMEMNAMAIARENGVLCYANDTFMRLLVTEWPNWQGDALPTKLHAALIRHGSVGFEGKAVAVRLLRIGELIFLRANRASQAQRLSPREREVAQLFSGGYSYKEIARQLTISPATVRNVLQRVYAKLEVRNKIELVDKLKS